jgi:hypothetical protein
MKRHIGRDGDDTVHVHEGMAFACVENKIPVSITLTKAYLVGVLNKRVTHELIRWTYGCSKALCEDVAYGTTAGETSPYGRVCVEAGDATLRAIYIHIHHPNGGWTVVPERIAVGLWRYVGITR